MRHDVVHGFRAARLDDGWPASRRARSRPTRSRPSSRFRATIIAKVVRDHSPMAASITTPARQSAASFLSLARPPQADHAWRESVRALERRACLAECYFCSDGGACVLTAALSRLKARLYADRGAKPSYARARMPQRSPNAPIRQASRQAAGEAPGNAHEKYPVSGDRMKVVEFDNGNRSVRCGPSSPKALASRCRCYRRQMQAGKITSLFEQRHRRR